MGNMGGWDVALLAAAGYIAVTALVRLMIRRRDQLVGEFREQLTREKSRIKAERRDQRAERKQSA